MRGRIHTSLLASLLAWLLPGAAALAATDALPPHATWAIDSAILHEHRVINVYLPPGYASHPDARFPVLYMLDGGMQEDFPHVARDVDAAIRSGRMRPMLVIGIANTRRRRDMTGPTRVASDRAIAPQVGGSADFRAFIAKELMPDVRRRYRTDGHVAIVGESLAGLFVVETFLLQPDLFGTYVAISPSFWWNDQALVRSARDRLRAMPPADRTFYFTTAGDDGNEEASAMLQAALRATAPKGLTWHFRAHPRLHHSDIYRRASPAIFRDLFPPR